MDAWSLRIFRAILSKGLHEAAERIQRSKSWIICQALAEWLAEEQHRHELTLEGLTDIDEGRVPSHEEILAWVAVKRRARLLGREGTRN